jgi:hypothetical protein
MLNAQKLNALKKVTTLSVSRVGLIETKMGTSLVWIPASAGMTEIENVLKRRTSCSKLKNID